MGIIALLLELVVPAVVILTTLFGVLAGGNPRPGGVALFLRVGLVGTAIGFVLFYLDRRLGLSGVLADIFGNGYRGLIAGSMLLVAMGAFGSILKTQKR